MTSSIRIKKDIPVWSYVERLDPELVRSLAVRGIWDLDSQLGGYSNGATACLRWLKSETDEEKRGYHQTRYDGLMRDYATLVNELKIEDIWEIISRGRTGDLEKDLEIQKKEQEEWDREHHPEMFEDEE